MDGKAAAIAAAGDADDADDEQDSTESRYRGTEHLDSPAWVRERP